MIDHRIRRLESSRTLALHALATARRRHRGQQAATQEARALTHAALRAELDALRAAPLARHRRTERAGGAVADLFSMGASR